MIAVDANGADRGAAEVAAGARIAAARGAAVLLFGPAAELGPSGGGVEVVDAPVSVAKSADPARAVRSSPDASIVQAARAVRDGRADALVCGGGTGAALAAGLFEIRRAPGIRRPALALPLPIPGAAAPVTLIDVGANTEARAEHLVQFAFMGAAFARCVLGVGRPRVALLSNGAERERGGSVVLEAHEQLERRLGAGGRAATPTTVAEAAAGADGGRAAARDSLADPAVFVGNIEGDAFLEGVADVVVTDGFTGNVALKLIEGVSTLVLRSVRDAAMASPRGRIGGLLLAPSLRAFRAAADPEAQGGAYLLGLRRLAVVPHGRFGRAGYAAAIARAHAGAERDVVGQLHATLARAGALRGGAGAEGTSADKVAQPGAVPGG